MLLWLLLFITNTLCTAQIFQDRLSFYFLSLSVYLIIQPTSSSSLGVFLVLFSSHVLSTWCLLSYLLYFLMLGSDYMVLDWFDRCVASAVCCFMSSFIAEHRLYDTKQDRNDILFFTFFDSFYNMKPQMLMFDILITEVYLCVPLLQLTREIIKALGSEVTLFIVTS